MNKELLLQEMKTAGVDRVVIVPPSFEGDYNDLALDAAHSYPELFAVMGRLNLKALVSRTLSLGEINEAIAGMRDGSISGRCIIRMQ